MTPQQILDVLSQNRLLQTAQQVAAFEQALEQFAHHPQASDHLRPLHLVLDERTEQFEVMFGVIHLLESFDVDKQIQAFIDVLPVLQQQAPTWVKTLNFRLLNDDAARSAYKTAFRAANTASRSVLDSMLAEIVEKEPQPLCDHASDVVSSA